MIYSELLKISKLIDTHAFIKLNKSDFSFCPEPPDYSTEYPETRKENKTRIDGTIKTFVKNNPPVTGEIFLTESEELERTKRQILEQLLNE